ncbi:hypothetical protein GCM10027048_39310 [Hymenobacter coalescens]
MQFAYRGFSSQPTAAQLDVYPGASLWYLLGGELTITAQERTFLREDFPLFRLAALLHHWQAYRPVPLDDCRLTLEGFPDNAALLIRRQAPAVALVWTEHEREVHAVTVPESEFRRASQAFLTQLQADVQVQLGVEISYLFKGIPF